MKYYSWKSEDTIGLYVESFDDIEYDINTLGLLLEKHGYDIYKIRKIEVVIG